MFSRFVARAHWILVGFHGALWLLVAAAWSLAWREEAAPMGPTFNSAKRFLVLIDGVVSGSIDAVSMHLAIAGANRLDGDIGLWYATLFAGSMLLGGTLQWFLVGRLIQIVESRLGATSAVVLTGCLAVGVALAGLSWAM